MRAFDFAVIALIVLLGIWCLVLQVRSPVQPQAQQPQAASSGALEGRVERLESSLKAVEDRQAQAENSAAELARASEQPEKQKAGERAPALSKEDVERMIEAGVKKFIATPHREAFGPSHEAMEALAGKPDERLDGWVRDTVTALGLQTQDEGILKEIIQERNRKLAEELLRDPDTPMEAKFMKVFTGDFFKKVNDEMYDSLGRYYKDETLAEFRKRYGQNPPPLVLPSPEDGGVTVIHASPGRLKVNKSVSSPPKEEAPPQGH